MEPFIKKLRPVLVKIRPFAPLILTAIAFFIIGFSIKRIIPVAVINGDSVSRSEYNDLLLKRAGRSTMQEVLINHLIRQEADKRKITVDNIELNAQLDIVKRDLKEQNFTLDMYLTQQGITLNDFKDQIKTQLIVKKMFEPGIRVTDKEMEKFYIDNNITKGKNAILRSQRIAITQAITQMKLRQEYSNWVSQQLQQAKITQLIKL